MDKRIQDDGIRDNNFKDILKKQKKETIDVVLTEFDEEKYEAMIRGEEREEGRKEGLLLTLFELVSDGIISMEEAENKSKMTAEAFQDAIQSLKLRSAE